MKVAYIDSSCLVAMALGEPGFRNLMVRLSRYDQLFSSNLSEAELCSALVREGVRTASAFPLSWLTWVYPRRRLTPELERIVEVASPRGADLWHLACALFLRDRLGLAGPAGPAGPAGDLAFISLDRPQAQAAQALGFPGL